MVIIKLLSGVRDIYAAINSHVYHFAQVLLLLYDADLDMHRLFPHVLQPCSVDPVS
jgi:hypothetical protein